MQSPWKCPRLLAAVLAVWLAPWSAAASAGDFDGSRPLSGTTGRIVAIHPDRVQEDVDPDTVGLPRKFRIDFEAGLLRPSADSLVRRTLVIGSVRHVEGKIVLQGVDEGIEGVEDALAWSLTVSKKDGTAVLSASGAGIAYVVFGVCTPTEDGR